MRQTVLLIDDDEAMRRSTEQALDLAGFAVRSLASAEEALPYVGPGFNGAVISDIRMPGMDGIGLTEAARALHPGLPVLLTSGFADEAARTAVPGLGVGFLAKPFTVKTLGERIRELV